MSLSLGLPMALWALAALALPVLLHLARRERQQRTVFAALAWLDPRQRPRRRLRLQDLLLLGLRLLLVAALALLLARPLLTGAGAPATLVLRHPSLAATATPPPAGEARHWLAPGFPPIDGQPAPAPSGEVSSLLRDADAGLPAGSRLVVQVPALLDGLDAQPPHLSRPVAWQVEDGPTATASAGATPPRTLVLRGDPADPGARWLRAVQAAWQAPRAPDDAAPTGLPAPDALLAWTGTAAPETSLLDWARTGGTLLIDAAAPWPLPRAPAPVDADGWLQGAAHGDGRVLQWRRPLSPAAMPALLEADFPARLRARVWPVPAPARADARHWSPATGGAAPRPLPRPLDTPLLWAIALLFGVERLLATRRSAEAAA